MKNNIYILFNKIALRYGDVINYPTDQFAVNRLKKIMENPDSGILREETMLFRIGSVDLENGFLTTENSPVPIPFDVKEAEID